MLVNIFALALVLLQSKGAQATNFAALLLPSAMDVSKSCDAVRLVSLMLSKMLTERSIARTLILTERILMRRMGKTYEM